MRILGIPHVRGHRRPVPLTRRCGRERWSRRALGFSAVREHQNLWLLVGVARTRTRMSLDHPLGGKERLDLFTQEWNAVGLLSSRMRIAEEESRRRHIDTDPHPFRTLGTEAKALETKTNTCLAAPLVVWLLVTFLRKGVSGRGEATMMKRRTDLSPYPTGVAARLSAHCTFSFGRPGLLRDFSGGGSWGRGHIATDGGVVRHWG